ncbi:FtsW/RodA/SpoVE family cell cycle protein [Pontibacillus salicampi]|uniref:FtsW/RodA/SpoVE family cell cycle protein n=1 Tax=Pontibacillus salicampi TaxID=1449801 RepID=A0ABV6LT44_9BACI
MFNTGVKTDYWMLFLLFLFSIVSFLSIHSAQATDQVETNYMVKQMIWYSLGFVILFISIKLEIRVFYQLTWVLYIGGILVLAALLVAPESIADPVNNAKSWFQVPGLGSVQPSEYFKFIFILSLSRVVASHHRNFPSATIWSDSWLMGKFGVMTVIPLFFIMEQPDLGTSLVYIAILLGMLFVSGITYKILLPMIAAGFGICAMLLYFIVNKPQLLIEKLGVDEYQLKRIYAWLHPEKYRQSDSFQVYNSTLAIGSGELEGNGKGIPAVNVPEAHNDFIFSIIGENFGFMGAAVVITLYFALLYRMVETALHANDEFASYICVGVISMITFHVFENVGMATGLVPMTGIPLPLISYGGSSILGVMFAIGLVLNVYSNTHEYMFD